VYSAWAKVRKARWFAQHTELLGDRFDYHGRPVSVLAGRAVAVALLLLWSLAFEFGLALGLAALALFCAIGPALFASAQRFRLANSSWRGLRFSFGVPRGEVYRTIVPLLLLWTSGTILASAGLGGAALAVATLAAALGLPWAHERLKRLQHRHSAFGAQTFGFQPATAAFYGVYGIALALLVGGGLISGLIAAGASALFADSLPTGLPATAAPALAGILTFSGVAWLFAWPFFAARLQRVVWSHTHWGDLRFRGEMTGMHLWRLVLVQTALVLLTAGLYWPFAAVALARYRVESLVVIADQPVRVLEAQGVMPGAAKATGDAAADFFGLDLGW
jgi:uncharacterized membrane protein YjgN (DUF898 family)